MIFQLNEQGRHRRIECTSANTPSGNEMAGVSVTARAPCMVAQYIHTYIHEGLAPRPVYKKLDFSKSTRNKMHRRSLNLAEGVI
jgi:hypothetical protein